MEINKKFIGALAIGAIIATAGVVAVQARAQNNISATAPSPAATGTTTATNDTDNIQDPNGIEQVDKTNSTPVDNQADGETNDNPAQ